VFSALGFRLRKFLLEFGPSYLVVKGSQRLAEHHDGRVFIFWNLGLAYASEKLSCDSVRDTKPEHYGLQLSGLHNPNAPGRFNRW